MVDTTAGVADFRPHLAITVGDPAGIGPEVILKALADTQGLQRSLVTVVGSRPWLEQTYRQLRALNPDLPLADPAQLTILDISDPTLERTIAPGKESAASGAASFHYLEVAIAHTLRGKFDGIVTGPIAKSAWKAAGHHYPGQTERLAEMAGVKRFGMLFVARSPYTGWTLRTLLATTHIPLRQVPDTLTPELMTCKLDLLVECLQQDFGIEQPKIAISGLNPHSGEQGQLGWEEQTWLIPWLESSRCRLSHVQLEGPVPPDTLWVKPGQGWFGVGSTADARFHERPAGTALHSPAKNPNLNFNLSNLADAYLALYHDQGLIPVKLMAFDRAVNSSIGLPFVRTSPDHGTAFDIAGKGIASASSMNAAIQLATDLVQQRQRTFSFSRD
ncbi:4-hydroxythreonine-4-phosphate dehydrogenase PdxA [Leptothermofonsia sichuanensis E412]|uniref:4-hydroxythreonine-4-phosphate dehydrogenase PdxA n=1 Tax=Leptothermofonsia sichuanensis TaxID=2917832 RepID=UPI001CA6E10C|nr:4-hydroxythreonine-4-phosphate dehydrogenase PdxA [Leptothermofonsia sichuanensis]QZZ21158.1 4-hydroxythreonine-4-phosphate dehydrogenase PdxA [Leptothermofonsia sichuanensis E412]